MSRFIFMAAIILLLATAFSLVIGHQGFAVNIILICFWFTIVGCILYLLELRKRRD